jgi:hypothetical protein
VHKLISKTSCLRIGIQVYLFHLIIFLGIVVQFSSNNFDQNTIQILLCPNCDRVKTQKLEKMEHIVPIN